MGISGIFKEIGQGQRISLAKVSSDHYAAHDRPFRLAIDISIWLFQIQAGKGGSNPALRTFYYRLLRLLTLNIHPLFVFDGPNKPLFKRNKKVGGPGVRVASVPEFLAKQLLKQFGFPWHVAPGEAEAECALLQREGIVDAVLSEDVDTLMFGSGVTLRNWSAENTSKSPTHVNVYRAAETKEKSGLDREGMILVALMSGGDYITEGIPKCGPKVACDAARAGFGKELIALAKRRDMAGLNTWRERLQHEIKTNESRYFSRKSSTLMIPEDFPNREVLGYYTDPCVSTPDKLALFKQELKWDQEIDFPALRSFAADAFDWRCLGGAKKFIRNLAPAMLVRDLRLRGKKKEQLEVDIQAEREQAFVLAIHGKRTHSTTDKELEYQITFIPQNLVHIDLSIEDEDDDFIPAGGEEEQLELDDEWAQIPSSTAADEDETPASPTKKRTMKPYHPDQPEKIWMMKSFLQIGCPYLIEDYEASLLDPKKLLKQNRKARAAAKGDDNIHAKKSTARGKKKATDVPPQNTLPRNFPVSKSSQIEPEELTSSQEREPLKAVNTGANARPKKSTATAGKQKKADVATAASGFRIPSTQGMQPPPKPNAAPTSTQISVGDLLSHTFDSDDETPKASKTASKPPAGHFAAFAQAKTKQPDLQKTPQRRKRRSADLSSPARSQRTLDGWVTPTPKKQSLRKSDQEIINLISSSPAKPMEPPRPVSPTPDHFRGGFFRAYAEEDEIKLPDSVTKRRKPLKRARTAPTIGDDDVAPALPTRLSRPSTPELPLGDNIEAMDLANTPLSAKRIDALSGEAAPAMPLFQPVAPSEAPSKHKSTLPPKPSSRPTSSGQLRRSPRQKTAAANQSSLIGAAKVTKKRIVPRDSLPGSWKEVDAETIDLSGDGSGWKQSGGTATLVATERVKVKVWRKSRVEMLDLTGA